MYRFLDHPSEAWIEITAPSVPEVFQDAATALFEVMTDTFSIRPEIEFRFTLESDTRNELLVDWLNRLIWFQEVEKAFFSRFEVQIQQNQKWKLEAMIRGERITERSERRSEVKSATYGLLEWKESGSQHLVRFVLDI
jgi:SHS2 domain-containing protein